ncbi:serine/threonine-protein kinase [Streptomyces plicatus]|uniref:non-specific serine/threonine protein kinase n=1 Tax=Streptomyces plicatus TaxID=1922 RepID=A0ABW1XZ22_STRPL
MGEVFAGRYELVDPVGRGGVGAVWRAWDHRRRRYVAAKVLQQRDAHALLRFVREQALRIDHPNVLAPASWAADDDQVLFTMDLVAGGSLVHLVGDYGPLPPAFVCTLLDQLLAGLAAVHAEGVVHRDIKPANLLLEATGTGRPRLRLSDFGIAMRLGEPRLTETNLVVGTPGYLAPEQMMGAEPDFPADLFAVGLVALYLLEGAKPDAKALVQYFAEHGTPPAPQGIPEPLWQVVAALVQPDPAARFRTATGARKALAAAAELLPEPGPDDELIEIFDQVGPLPPGFTADGPLVRATGLNRTPPSPHGPATPPSPHGTVTPPAPRSDSPPLAAPPPAPPSGRRSAPGDGDPSGTPSPATDRAPEPPNSPAHTGTPPPGTPSPSPTPLTPSSDGRPTPPHGNPTGPGTPSPSTDPAPEPPNSPAHTGTPPPGTPWSSPGPLAPPLLGVRTVPGRPPPFPGPDRDATAVRPGAGHPAGRTRHPAAPAEHSARRRRRTARLRWRGLSPRPHPGAPGPHAIDSGAPAAHTGGGPRRPQRPRRRTLTPAARHTGRPAPRHAFVLAGLPGPARRGRHVGDGQLPAAAPAGLGRRPAHASAPRRAARGPAPARTAARPRPCTAARPQHRTPARPRHRDCPVHRPEPPGDRAGAHAPTGTRPYLTPRPRATAAPSRPASAPPERRAAGPRRGARAAAGAGLLRRGLLGPGPAVTRL